MCAVRACVCARARARLRGGGRRDAGELVQRRRRAVVLNLRNKNGNRHSGHHARRKMFRGGEPPWSSQKIIKHLGSKALLS
eukprot:6177022-Pleurochrysis_carterae.AAC.1